MYHKNKPQNANTQNNLLNFSIKFKNMNFSGNFCLFEEEKFTYICSKNYDYIKTGCLLVSTEQ